MGKKRSNARKGETLGNKAASKRAIISGKQKSFFSAASASKSLKSVKTKVNVLKRSK